MKLFYLFLAIAFTHNATAQDYCKRVKKEVLGNNIQFDFTSPSTPHSAPSMEEMSPLYVRRNISKDEDNPFDNFFSPFLFIQRIWFTLPPFNTGGNYY